MTTTPRSDSRSGASEEITFAIRVKPGARRARTGGRYDGTHGPALIVAVTSPAIDGRATTAALRAVAEVLGIKSREIRLVSGTRSRDKVVGVTAPDGQERARLEELLDQLLSGPGPADDHR